MLEKSIEPELLFSVNFIATANLLNLQKYSASFRLDNYKPARHPESHE